MVTVPEAVEKVIKRSRYLSEALSKNIVNISSLARYIQPEVESIIMKPASKASLIMAIKRLSVTRPVQQKYKLLLQASPDMTVRSNLKIFYIRTSTTLIEKLKKIYDINNDNFLHINEDGAETTLICSKKLEKKMLAILKDEDVLSEFDDLSAITIGLPKEAVTTPGVYYFFLKSLAWEEINVIEITSSYQNMTLVFEDKDINRAFTILKGLFINKE